MIDYVWVLVRYYPKQLIEFLLILIIMQAIANAFFSIIRMINKAKISVPQRLMAPYIVLIAWLTLIFRSKSDEYRLQWIPFWSYYNIIIMHEWVLLVDNILNIILMIPAGVLLPLAFENVNLKGTIKITVIIELTIELAQLIFQRGVAEWDDIIHGCVGAALGYSILMLIKKIRTKQAYNGHNS